MRERSHWRRHPWTGMAVELRREERTEPVVVLGWGSGPRSSIVRLLLLGDRRTDLDRHGRRRVIVQSGEGDILVVDDSRLVDPFDHASQVRDAWVAAGVGMSRSPGPLPREGETAAGVDSAPAAADGRLVGERSAWIEAAHTARRVPLGLRRGLAGCRLVELHLEAEADSSSVGGVTVRAIVADNGRRVVVWAMDAWSRGTTPPSVAELARRARGRRMLEAARHRQQWLSRQVAADWPARPRRRRWRRRRRS